MRYKHTPAHPDKVAGLNDAAVLARLSEHVDGAIESLSTHPARQALMDANVTINAAIRELNP